jgi:hypothetical protein
MEVRLPDGTTIKDVPEGMTQSQLLERLRAAGYQGGLEQPVEAANLPKVAGASADKGGGSQGFVAGLRTPTTQRPNWACAR